MIGHMRHGSSPRLMALQSILSPNRRESLPTPSAGVRITGPARVLREDRSLHPHRGRDHVESLARLLANPMERTGAAGADRGLGLNHLLAARQMLGKSTDIAYRRPARSIHLALSHALIVGGRWRRGG